MKSNRILPEDDAEAIVGDISSSSVGLSSQHKQNLAIIGVPAASETSKKHNSGKNQGFVSTCFSLQVCLPVGIAVWVMCIIAVSVAPMSSQWASSINHVTSVCHDSLLEDMDLYRSSLIQKVVTNVSVPLTVPPAVVFLLSKLINSSKYTDSIPVQQHWSGFPEEVHPFAMEYPEINTITIGWVNAYGDHQYTDSRSFFALYDSSIASNFTFHAWDANGNPTNTILPTTISNFNLTTRSWWKVGMNALDGAWTAPYLSARVEEGMLIAFVTRLPIPGATVCLQVAHNLGFLETYFAEYTLTPNGIAFLTDNANLNMLAASPGLTLLNPSGSGNVNAPNSPNETVSGVAKEWLKNTNGTHVEYHFHYQGDLLVDVVPVEASGGLLLWLFVVTPEADFVGQLSQAQQKAEDQAYVSLWSVLGGELFLLLLALILSIIMAYTVSKALKNVVNKLRHISNGHFSRTTSNSNLGHTFSEVKDLNCQVATMQLALDSFSKYVPTQVVHYLCKYKLTPVVGVTCVPCTVLFLDIVDFTKKMDLYGATMILEVLGIMFESFSTIITQNGGCIDKYIGDAIMAVWGCPYPVERAEVHACRAISDILAELQRLNEYFMTTYKLTLEIRIGRLNEYFMTTYKLTLEIRIGVHSGEVQAGNVGSSHRLNYTVLGNTVNLASRLEAVNKEVGTQVLASNSFRSCAGGDFAFRALGSISVRGFQDLVLVHQFLGAMDRLDPTTKQLLKDYLEIDKALCEGQSNIDPMIASFLEVHPEDKTNGNKININVTHGLPGTSNKPSTGCSRVCGMTSDNGIPIRATWKIDARSQFLALACGATASGRGPVSLLSNAFEVLAYEIGRKWVVSCSRRWGFGVGEGHSKDEIPCGDCCLVVFFGVSHTLGLVWHKLHLFGGCNFGASKPCANGMQIGCYLGSSKWMSYLPWAVDRDGAFVMNEDDGRIVGRIRGSVSTLNWVESFHSNGKWLVQICRKSKMRVWRLREGVPEGHCVLIRNRPDHRIFGTRFLPWGDENEVVVVSQSKEKHASDLLFVDLQTSVFNEALVVTSSISVPYEADDILCLPRQEFLVLSRDFSIEMGFRRFTYNTLTRRLFYFPGDVQFVPPSHVLNRPRLDHNCRIYAASDLGQPLRQFQQHGCQHPFFRMTTTDRWIANGDPSVSLNVYDLVTGTTVLTLTRTLKSPGVAGQHSGETIPQHHSPRPRSPPWPPGTPWLHF
ncbi:adenylate cyclase [Pelomyxa schiedti]|nr:adenylate cyclase [Pelomyxa schiedti]